ncbi:hypothetical protein [Cupriavidus sp. IK-TO18]|uniref:hypothetical protein n=1 Tax=Cupriavidus sp. IK-TO18 TaxID=2782182 RepID=UPI00189A3AE9|nr:hypothetical protein [Cupriavidus sp. IK-TO18]MBF6990788.1 hypothetical protein [Cupriavidus sp. IK-TO18]
MNWLDHAGLGLPGNACSRQDDAVSSMAAGVPNHYLVISAYTHREVVLRQLSFPYAVSVDLERQTAWCNDRSASRTLRPGRRTTIPSLTRFDLHLSANASVQVQVQPEDMENFSRQARKPMTHALARCVFLQPGRNWTRHECAALLHLSTSELSRQLFAEGECMRDTVRSSRLSKFLVDLPQLPKVNNRLAAAYGFHYQYLLEEAVYESFGVTLATLTALIRMNNNVIPWHHPLQ